jgi:hypothetical protein
MADRFLPDPVRRRTENELANIFNKNTFGMGGMSRAELEDELRIALEYKDEPTVTDILGVFRSHGIGFGEGWEPLPNDITEKLDEVFPLESDLDVEEQEK